MTFLAKADKTKLEKYIEEEKELQKIVQKQYDEYWAKNPGHQVLPMNMTYASFFTEEKENRSRELNRKIEQAEYARRGINSVVDLKEIVKLKRKLRVAGIEYVQNSTKSELIAKVRLITNK